MDFGEETGIIEIKICILSGALVFNPYPDECERSFIFKKLEFG